MCLAVKLTTSYGQVSSVVRIATLKHRIASQAVFQYIVGLFQGI
jgi:hypothetical protein